MSSPKRLGVLASGRGTDLQSIIDTCEAGHIDAEVSCIISDNKDAGALQRAKQYEIPYYHVDYTGKKREIAEEEITAHFTSHDCDLLVGAGFMRLFSSSFVTSWHHRLINIHPALLPSFRGIHGQKDALEYGVKITGCTTHFVDEDMDNGPIILQAAVIVFDTDTTESLSQRILLAEHQILPRTIDLITKERITIQGRHTVIEHDDDSWKDRFPVLSGVLYSDGY